MLRNLSITDLNEQLQLSIRQNIYHFVIIGLQIAPEPSGGMIKIFLYYLSPIMIY